MSKPGHALSSRHVQESRIVINSNYSDKDLLSLHAWSKEETKQRFKSAMACTKYRDHRTYAQVLFSNGDRGHKVAFNNTEHEDNLVTDLSAPKQVVSTVSSIGVDNSIETNTRKWHAKGRHVTGQKTNTLKNLRSDPTVDDQVHNCRVSNAYNIPVTNKFQLLRVDQEIQVSTDSGISDHTVVAQKVCKGIMSHARLDNESNIYHTSLVSDSIHTHSSDTVQHDPDPDSTQLKIIDTNPDLVPEYHKCKAQIGTKFGCIPLAPIYVYKGEPKVWGTVPDVLTAHRLTRGMLLLTKAKRPLKFKMLCGFNKHAVKLRMHKAALYAFPIPLNTF